MRKGQRAVPAVGIKRPKDEPVKAPGTERDKERDKETKKVETKRGVITWADVVKGTSGIHQEKVSNRNKIVLGSLSQNNPGSKDEV